MFAVDHFRGNLGKESLYRVNGELDNLQAQFEHNMHTVDLHDVVTTVPFPSEQAYPQLADRVLRFLFIDGDHTELGVKKDVELFCPLVRTGGIVVFDDFDNTFPGVVSAAEQWIQYQRPRVVFVSGNLLVCKI